jgi:hypothetical protein
MNYQISPAALSGHSSSPSPNDLTIAPIASAMGPYIPSNTDTQATLASLSAGAAPAIVIHDDKASSKVRGKRKQK